MNVLALILATFDWPWFLGPTHNMMSAETNLLKKLSPAGPPLLWQLDKGESYASPSVRGERLILFHRLGDREVVDCLHARSGKPFWRFAYPTAYRDRYGYNHGPRASPVISHDAVFTIGAEGKLHCLELGNGKLRWQRDVVAEFKLKQNFFGVGSTPLLEQDKLIVNVGADGGPCVVAFDARNGREIWRSGTQWGPSYASPVPATVHGRRRVFVFAGGESDPPTGGLVCLDPHDGKIAFEFPWRGRRYESVNASSPVVFSNRVFISECYGSGGALLEVLPDGEHRLLWTNPKFGTHFMTSIHKDGHLYGIDGYVMHSARLVCVEAATGRELWSRQPTWEEVVHTRNGPRKFLRGTFRGSLLWADGHFLCLGELGHLLWLDLTPHGCRLLDRVRLFAAQETWTPPVLAHGLLYICQNTPDLLHNTPPRLLCYDLRRRQD
ncbi:MAG: PQQ-like beta-propeller repeat protein [Verrucomicrobiae bacterium]|nr:PQQ-like beta-propeller repeat protein [Verrucomicrobiae bacterium]